MDCIFVGDTVGSVTLVIANLATGNNWVYFAQKDFRSRIWFIIFDFLIAHVEKVLKIPCVFYDSYMDTYLRSKIWKRHALFYIFATFMVLPFCSSLPENVLSLFSNIAWPFGLQIIVHKAFVLLAYALLNVRFKRQVFFVIGPLNWHWLKIIKIP